MHKKIIFCSVGILLLIALPNFAIKKDNPFENIKDKILKFFNIQKPKIFIGPPVSDTMTPGLINSPISNNFTLGPGDYDFSLKVGSATRKYLIHIPNSYKKIIQAPLVMAFHGGLGNSSTMTNDERFQWISKSNAEGFIVAFPNGASRRADGTLATWNAGNCCGYAVESKSDDVGFVKEVIKDVESKFNINKNKVFATGMSNGGMMDYRLACEMSDTFSAIASVAGTDNFDGCIFKKPISIMHIHSLVDQHVLFNGGCGPQCISLKAEADFTSVPETISRWVKRNKCIGNPLKVTKDTGAYCETYSRCANDVKVKLCVTDDGGHSWPGGAPVSGGTPVSQKINPTDEIWNFFKTR